MTYDIFYVTGVTVTRFRGFHQNVYMTPNKKNQFELVVARLIILFTFIIFIEYYK